MKNIIGIFLVICMAGPLQGYMDDVAIVRPAIFSADITPPLYVLPEAEVDRASSSYGTPATAEDINAGVADLRAPTVSSQRPMGYGPGIGYKRQRALEDPTLANP